MRWCDNALVLNETWIWLEHRNEPRPLDRNSNTRLDSVLVKRFSAGLALNDVDRKGHGFE
jgi:hypothetical protein